MNLKELVRLEEEQKLTKTKHEATKLLFVNPLIKKKSSFSFHKNSQRTVCVLIMKLMFCKIIVS
jgi:hypothetical protein